MNFRFSERATRMMPSAIRNKLFDDPAIITFAAGKPEQSIFPLEDLLALTQKVISDNGKNAFQYCSTEGLLSLREIIARKQMKAANVNATAENIVLTSGSQEGIELAGKLFINEGDMIICESPSYVGAFNAFAPYNPNYIAVSTDENGMIMEELEAVLKANPNVKLIYTIPDFQNPTGVTMSDGRRMRLAQLAAEYQVPVVEDCPYGDLIFEGNRHPAVKSFDKEGWVITLGSFSKTLCPGLRVGWACAHEAIVDKFILAKQGSNLQSGTFDQCIVDEYLRSYSIDDHIKKLQSLYRSRRDTTLESLKEYFPSEVKYTHPNGGFFVWVELKKGIDTSELLMDAAVNAKVAFVPGSNFFARGEIKHFLRLSYSFVDEEKIRTGLARLGGLLTSKYYLH